MKVRQSPVPGEPCGGTREPRATTVDVAGCGTFDGRGLSAGRPENECRPGVLRHAKWQRLTQRLLRPLRTIRRGTARYCRGELLRRAGVLTLTAAICLSGCSTTRKKSASELTYLHDGTGESYYRGRSTAIEYPCLDNVTAESVQASFEPRNLQRRIEDEVRELSLSECIRTALSHNDVIETSALGGIGTKQVLLNPNGASSVYDAAIQESGVLFGRRGLDAALSDFDTTFSSGITWGRDRRRLNLAGAPMSVGETAGFEAALRKSFATGASVRLSHDWDYLGTNSATALFPSSYAGNLGAELRQPLLAGSGVDFTRIAGPVNPSLFTAITGVSQGVVIARINQDITLADFEIAVRNAVLDIENAYWDLFLRYRTYDTAVAAHESAFQTWREAQTRFEVGTLKPADELQARDRLYETKASVEVSLNDLYRAETELRRLIGLPMNDGTILRPADRPSLAQFVPDWHGSLLKGLTQRVELRRQKWQIKSLQLQLSAANSLVRPRLDAVSSYNINGFGDRLLGQEVTDPTTGLPIRSGYGSMTNDDQASWTLGMQFSMPIGFRQARSQVRNLELQVARASAILASQERNIAHDISTTIQDVTVSYTAAQTNLNRMKAAAQRVDLLDAEREVGTTTLDLVLRAQASVASAENAFYQQVVQYNKAIAALHLATGDLLEFRNVWLAEGRWNAEAYEDARLRAAARRHASDNPHLATEPPEFVSPGPAGTVELRPPAASESQSPSDDAAAIPESEPSSPDPADMTDPTEPVEGDETAPEDPQIPGLSSDQSGAFRAEEYERDPDAE